MRAADELIQEVISEATSALLEWLDEGWITTTGEWNVEKAQVNLSRDWYAPCWIVTFTIDAPPWFGDSVSIEVEELGYNQVQANIDRLCFADDSITCGHKEDVIPEGHWSRKSGHKR